MFELSVLTPSFNQGKYLRKNIESVQQLGASVQHIIMDGGSTDNSIEILKELSKEYANIVWISEQDKGQTDALRKALMLASGEFIGWLNVDEYYEPHVWPRVKQAFERTSANVVYGDFRRVTSDDRLIRVNRQWPYDMKIGSLVTPIIQNCAAFFRTQALLDAGAFTDTSLVYTMDWDLFLRVIKRPADAEYIPVLLASFTMHADSKTSQAYEGFVAEVQSMRRRLYPHRSVAQIERLRKFHYFRLVLLLLLRGELWDKAIFKLFHQHAFEAEYGHPGVTWFSRFMSRRR